MRRTFPALPALAAAVVIALVAALVALAMAEPSGQDRAAGDLVAAAASGSDEDPDEGADGDDSGPPSDKAKDKAKDKARHGDGPPPWAHGRGGPEHRVGKQAHAEWQKRWHGMSQQQREATMRRLSTEHASGMKAWAKCHAADRDDCSKPMPPGLAKKQ